MPYPIAQSLPYICARLQDGSYRPVIDRRYPLAEAADAYAYVLTGTKTGNVVLEVRS